jgi:hypothetical protein
MKLFLLLVAFAATQSIASIPAAAQKAVAAEQEIAPTGDEVAIDEGGCTLILRTLADEGATDRIVEAAQKWAAAHGRTPQSARWQYTAGKKKILVLEIAFEDP